MATEHLVESTQVVQATLGVLVLFSVLTWSVIILKCWDQWRLSRANRRYQSAFWGAEGWTAAAGLEHRNSGLGRLAEAGFFLLHDWRSAMDSSLYLKQDLHVALERCLRQQVQREKRVLEQGLALLASIGSTAPFVGLFGTVLGIMHALQEISTSGSASLDVVAGPIGEALVATAIGIAAAIPAVLAYNFFLRQSRLNQAEMEHFATDFLHLAIKSELQV